MACLFREHAHHFVNSVYYATLYNMYVLCLTVCLYNEWTRQYFHLFIPQNVLFCFFFFCVLLIASCWISNKMNWEIENIFETLVHQLCQKVYQICPIATLNNFFFISVPFWSFFWTCVFKFCSDETLFVMLGFFVLPFMYKWRPESKPYF